MENLLYYIRDHLTGTHYFIYAFILLIFMFALIGYLFKQKYGKLDIVLNTSQSKENNKDSNSQAKGEKQNKMEEKQSITTETTMNKLNENSVASVATKVPTDNKLNNVEEPTIIKNLESNIPTPLPATPVPENPVPIPNVSEPVNPQPIPNETQSENVVKPLEEPKNNEPIPEI